MENPFEQEQHSSLKYLLQSDRVYEKFEDIKKIDYILKEYIGLKNMVLKDFEDKPEIYFQRMTADGDYIMQIERKLDFIDNKFIIYKTLNKHIEICFNITEIKDNLVQCRPIWAKIAKFPRRHKRMENREDTVYASNFVVTPPALDLTKITGFSGQMVLENEHKSVCSDPRSRLVFFDKATITPEVSILKLHKLPIAIQDTNTMANLVAEDMKFFDLKTFYEEEHLLQDKITGFTQKDISAFIYYPVFFKNGKYLLPIGYFYFETHDNTEISGILAQYREIESRFNNKMQQSNQIEIKTRQNILNISEGGFLLQVTDEDLIKCLKHKTEFNVDLIFKKQQPLKFRAMVKFIAEGTSWLVGAEIIGSSDTKKNMDNLRSFLKLIPAS